jgi:RimJ/RimL family protein N-acetyltransferase
VSSALESFDIRYTYITDLPLLRGWLLDPRVQTWFPVGDEREVEEAVQCWVGFARYSASLTATVSGKPCGMATLFLMPYRKVAHHALFKIVVDPRFQRRGIGTALLRNIKHLARDYFHLDLIHTEVFEGNPCVHLLEKQGFTAFARQGGFVKDGEGYRGRICYEVHLNKESS